MNQVLHDTFLQVLHKELIPALGCTEPIAIAYAAAKARQVLGENLALTVAGGIVGLLIAYLIIATCSQWILPLFDDMDLYSFAEISPRITPEMLFSPWIIGCAFGACLLLNVISALIPTVWALRHSIIESLHSKQ